MRIIIALALLAGTGLVVVLFASPQLDDISSLRAEEEDIRSSLSELRDLQERRDELLSTYNAIHPSDLERLDIMIPESRDTGVLIAEFNRIATQNNMVLRSVEIAQQDEQTRRQRTQSSSMPASAEMIPLSLRVVGSYDAFRSLLDRLERSTRVIDAREISFESRATGIYEFTIEAHAYWTGRSGSSAQ